VSSGRIARPRAALTESTRKKSALTADAATRSGSSPPVMFALPAVYIASPSKLFCSARQSLKSGDDMLLWLIPFEGLTPANATMRSAPGNGSGRSSTAFTTEKMAVFAPTPNASTTTATTVNPGFFASARTPYLTS
jgi:hypothetical protein